MFFSKKLLTLMLFCLYTLLAIIEYIPYHIFLLSGSYGASVIHTILAAVIDFLLPALLATVMLVRFCERRTGKVLLECAIVSLSRIFFYAPYFYMDLFARGADTAEAIPLALLLAFLVSLGFALVTTLTFLLARYVHARKARAIKTKQSPKVSLREMLLDGGSFDTSGRGVSILFTVSLVTFIVNLPVVDTVDYFISYADTIRMNEILYIILEVLFLLGMMLLTQLIITKFATALLRDE